MIDYLDKKCIEIDKGERKSDEVKRLVINTDCDLCSEMKKVLWILRNRNSA